MRENRLMCLNGPDGEKFMGKRGTNAGKQLIVPEYHTEAEILAV